MGGDYYLRPDERFVAIRQAYTGYITRLFTLGNLKDPGGAAARILAFETTLAQKQWDRARSRDRNATYNKTTLAALQTAMPAFDWRGYFSQVLPGTAAAGLKDVIVRQPDYLEAVDAAMPATSVETWRDYLTFGLITCRSQTSTRFMPPSICSRETGSTAPPPIV
jgi:putative endopeptidase